jgi:hypothetical protein
MMKSVMLATLTISLLGVDAATAVPPLASEAKLAHLLRDRTAGRPLDCLSLRYTRSTRVIGDTAIIFESASTLYVNRPLAGAESLSESNALLLNSLTGEVCRGEGIRLFDNASQLETGVIFLGQFVPYRKARADRQRTIGGGRPSYR